MERLYLKKGEDRRLRLGHLWVFSNEIDVDRSPLAGMAPGQTVEVSDCAGRVLGTGYANPASLISVRMVSHSAGTPLDAGMLRERLTAALDLRGRLFDEPYYRLCHGEGDMLPGLVVDRHGDFLVCQISTAGMDVLTDEIVAVLADMLHPRAILLDNDLASRSLEGLERFQRAALGTVPEEILIRENDLSYAIPLTGGQKTGWFYDQRLNRAAFSHLVRHGDSVLDAFCYAGGFGAAAAKAGAGRVTFLDASALALGFAERNALNASSAEVTCMKGDALDVLADLRKQGSQFDMVCLDPPAFIKRRKDMRKGLEAYARVNSFGMDLVRPGGVFMTCSCSHHLETESLRSIAMKSMGRKRRTGRLLFQGFQGPDHPIHPAMPETAYLKAFMYQLD